MRNVWHFVAAAFCLIGCGATAPARAPDLRLALGEPRSVIYDAGAAADQPIAMMDLADSAVALYVASDHRADDTTAGGRAVERLSVALPLGGTDRYPLDGVTAGLFYRNDATGLDLKQFRGYAWWQQESDGWQVEINAVSTTDPPVEVRASLSGNFIDHAMTGAPLNP